MNSKTLIGVALFIFAFVIPSGYMINYYLEKRYEIESKNSIIESFAKLSSYLQEGDKKTLNALKLLSKEIKLVASMNLITNYEDASNYDSNAFNEEKSRIIGFIQDSKELKRNDYVATYDATNTLVTLIKITKEPLTLFSAYKNSARIYYVKDARNDFYQEKKLSLKVASIVEELTLFCKNHTDSSQLLYQSAQKTLRVKSKVPIIRARPNYKDETVGYVIAFKEYPPKYLNTLLTPKVLLSYALISTKYAKNSLSFSGSKYAMPALFGEQGFNQLLIQKEEERFFARVKFPIKDGELLIKIEAK